MKLLRDVSIRKRRVLIRCDFNVPLNEKEEIVDDFRIRQTIPTIAYVLQQGGKVILLTHLGDPEGKVVEKLRLDPIRERLEKLLKKQVTKAQDCVGKEVREQVARMNEGEVLLLENVRFHAQETENDERFAKELAQLGDIFVNDAFSASHRDHASIAGIPRYLPSVSGFLLE